ncbi:hypothetical protein TNCV_3283971 [Trichonephila clavipes]|nr:hypothetical protein TNCV_3283971 [Trichonephila clavipes]
MELSVVALPAGGTRRLATVQHDAAQISQWPVVNFVNREVDVTSENMRLIDELYQSKPRRRPLERSGFDRAKLSTGKLFAHPCKCESPDRL